MTYSELQIVPHISRPDISEPDIKQGRWANDHGEAILQQIKASVRSPDASQCQHGARYAYPFSSK